MQGKDAFENPSLHHQALQWEIWLLESRAGESSRPYTIALKSQPSACVCVFVYRPQAGGLFSCSLYFVVPAQPAFQHPRLFLKCLAMMFLAKQDLEREWSKVQRVCQAHFCSLRNGLFLMVWPWTERERMSEWEWSESRWWRRRGFLM